MTLADVRDVAIIAGTIVFVVESLVIGVLLVVVGLRLLVFIDVAQARLDDVAVSADSILDSAREAATAANEAAAQVRGSTMFLSDRVVLPAIRFASITASSRRTCCRCSVSGRRSARGSGAKTTRSDDRMSR